MVIHSFLAVDEDFKESNANSMEFRKGTSPLDGEEDLGSDPQYAIDFLKTFKKMGDAGPETPQVKEMMARAAKHSSNVGKAMKVYN